VNSSFEFDLDVSSCFLIRRKSGGIEKLGDIGIEGDDRGEKLQKRNFLVKQLAP